MKGRLLDVTLGDAFSNVALEEALFRELRAPTLRTWVNQKSVVVGRAQLAEFETDLAYCRSHSVPVVRRFTAGGTVYNGPGNLNWSFFIPKNGVGLGTQLLGARQVFFSFGGLVVDALKRCGVKAEYQPPNSIVDGHGKISGIAAYLSRGAILCHGTLLVAAELDEVERLTRPSDISLRKRYPRSRFVPVSNCGVDVEDFVSELAHSAGFALKEGVLSETEAQLASDLAASKYRKDGWNLGDPFSLDDF